MKIERPPPSSLLVNDRDTTRRTTSVLFILGSKDDGVGHRL